MKWESQKERVNFLLVPVTVLKVVDLRLLPRKIPQLKKSVVSKFIFSAELSLNLAAIIEELNISLWSWEFTISVKKELALLTSFNPFEISENHHSLVPEYINDVAFVCTN